MSCLGSATAINERCIELQESGELTKLHGKIRLLIAVGVAASKRCPYVPNKDNEPLVHDFRDHVLAKIRDIEDLGILGKKMGICPYYTSRSTIKPSEVYLTFPKTWRSTDQTQIVTLPYPLLLQKSAREALDLSLKGHVVIIDEAHNLMDAIANIYSISVSLKQLLRSRAQLGVYLQKFRNRLKGKNRVYVAQTVRLLDSLAGYMQESASRGRHDECLVNVSDLMAGKGADQINLYKLMRYLQESKLARKVEGYLVHHEQQALTNTASNPDGRASKKNTGSVPVLTHIQNFLHALTNPSAEGRFFYCPGDNDAVLKYMLLDPTHHFQDIVNEARAVILAGGTMSPVGCQSSTSKGVKNNSVTDGRLSKSSPFISPRGSNHDIILRPYHSQGESVGLAGLQRPDGSGNGIHIRQAQLARHGMMILPARTVRG